MDNQTRFKLRIPRFFKSSYASCRSRIFSDATLLVGSHPSSTPQTHNSDISPSLPKLLTNSTSFPSICKPKSTQTLNPDSNHHKVTEHSKRRSSGGFNTHALFYYADAAASPVSSLVLDREFYQKPKSKKSRSKRMSRSSSRRYSSRRLCRVDSATFISSTSENEKENDDVDEEDDDVFFSSRSWSSSDSSRSFKSNGECETSMMMMKDSVAVVKSSSDPYEDFRKSMVEMIVEKQIMSGKDLEKLLQSFLALNSRHHHRVILEVFMEIWEAIFSDWS